MSHSLHRVQFRELSKRSHMSVASLSFILLSSLALLILFFTPSIARAQQTCGSIIGPETLYNFVGDYRKIVTVPIDDCTDPFNVTAEPPLPYHLEIDGVAVDEGDIYIQNEPIQEIRVLGSGTYNYVERFLFKHEGADYVFVSESVEPSEAEYRDFAATYFGTAAETDQYMTILIADLDAENTDQYFYDEDFNPLMDTNTGESVYDRYFNFKSAANTYLYGRSIEYAPGTYTMVIKESLLINSFWRNLREMFVKTAYAQSELGPLFYTITFSIADPTPEPAGASSVLFLPGIQASRLYTPGAAGTEDQVWEPNRDEDVLQLRMSSNGISINDIYTKDVIDEIAIPVIGGNIYKGLLGMLGDLVDDKVIKDYEAFAYDWRYSADDVVANGTKYEHEIRSAVAAVERLAEHSYSKKVTIISHSNGGLVAKALVLELERLGKAGLVDTVVFIATPHLGTPSAIATVLHGYDQQKLGGAVINDSTAREVINTMPGAYGLLPSQKYLELASEPVVTIGEGIATQSLYGAYGGEIEGMTEYKNFLLGLEGRQNVAEDISNPYRVGPYLLQDAFDMHSALDNWEAPAGIEVFNLVGTGLPTVRSVEYRNVTERKSCTGTFYGGIVCAPPVHILRPYVYFTQYGDGTVASLSAETVEGEMNYLDLNGFNRSLLNPFASFNHADITETDDVESFVENIINSTSTEIKFISKNQPAFDTEYEVTAIDSPVRIVKEDLSGNRTGVIVENGVPEVVKQIPGSEYVEFGGTKYILVPKGPHIVTYLYGEGLGSYTLTVATLAGDNQTIETELVNATTTPTMIARYEFGDGEYSTVATDFDGDGSVDLEMTLDGEVVRQPEITFDFLRAQISDLRLSKARATPLLLLVRLAEEAKKLRINPILADRISDGVLMQLRDTIKLYEKKRWITGAQRDDLINVINKLINL